MRKIFAFLLITIAFTLKTQAQQGVLIIFPEDKNFILPSKFLRNENGGVEDSTILRLLSLKYHFYNVLSQRMETIGYRPQGEINGSADFRKYMKTRWYFKDTALQKKNMGKNYYSGIIDNTNDSYFNLKLLSDSSAYILMINKVEVHSNIFRRLFATENYMMDVHFDIFDKNMNRICGRYIRKKVRLSKNTYWSSLVKQFSILPEELALYFGNIKK